MLNYNFEIVNDKIYSKESYEGKTGNVNYYKCNFVFSADWENLSKFAVFKTGDNCYVQALIDDVCNVPTEVLNEKGIVYIGAYGTNGSETAIKRISTNFTYFKVDSGAYSNGDTPQIPTCDVWETLINKMVPYIGENGNWYVYDTTLQKYVDSLKCAKGDKGDTGVNGYTPVKGIDYWTNADKAEIETDVLNTVNNDYYTKPQSDNRYLPQDTSNGTITTTEFAIEDNAINYKIYGNSVQNGTTTNNVGDLVTSGEHQGEYKIETKITGKNLFDKIFASVSSNWQLKTSSGYASIAYYVGVGNKLTASFSTPVTTGLNFYLCLGTKTGSTSGATWLYHNTITDLIKPTATSPASTDGYIYLTCSGGTIANFINSIGDTFQLEYGKTATTYETYRGSVISAYLDKPLRSKTDGTNTDYIDYENQKVVRNVGEDYQPLSVPTEESITLSALPLKEGTNNISCNTTVQPSNIEVAYYQNPTKVINNLKNLIVELGGN